MILQQELHSAQIYESSCFILENEGDMISLDMYMLNLSIISISH